jgi:elongation factor Ts
VQAIVDELAIKVGEKVQVRRFERLEVGEGVEKVAANLADEVAAMTA